VKLHSEAQAHAKRAALWSRWLASDWVWPLVCDAGKLSCSCKAHCSEPPDSNPRQIAYPLCKEQIPLMSMPYPINKWPHCGNLCINPAATTHRANFAMHRLLPGATDTCQNNEEWNWMCAKLHEGGLDSTYRPVGMLRVINRSLLAGFVSMYSVTRSKLASTEDFTDGVDRSASCAVRWLWHGSSCVDRIFDICKEGFDRSHAKTCLYGRGCYFAVKGTLADKYACWSKTPDGSEHNLRIIMLAAVICGEAALGTNNSYPAPTKPHSSSGERYENTVDNVQNPSMFVTYKDFQALPAYIVILRKR